MPHKNTSTGHTDRGRRTDYLAPFILIYGSLNETDTDWIALWEVRKSRLICSHSCKFAIGFSFWVLVQLLRIQFGAELQ